MTKIDIISGFLGAGKTTLIKKLLAEVFAGEKVVLIENEFGEIGIDGGFLKEAGIQIREMNSGCICCSLVGDFGASLMEVIQTYEPDRILIEPSGVGKLSDVKKAVNDYKEKLGLELNSFSTVVDVNKCKMYLRNFGEFYKNQIEAAGAVILSRTDTAKKEKIEECVELLQKVNDKVRIITTPIDQLDGKKLMEAMESEKTMEEEMLEEHHHHHHDHDHEHHHHHHHDHDHEHHHHHHHEHGEECTCGCCHEHHHHHADEIFTSWGKETIKVYNKEDLKVRLEALQDEAFYGAVLRAKGILEGDDGQWIYFDMVPGEIEIRVGEPDFTGRLCVIGANLQTEKLEQLFDAV